MMRLCLVATFLFSSVATADPLSDLFTAISKGDMPAFLHALDAGAPVNGLSANQATPLHAAVAAGRSEMVSLLFRRGAHVNTPDGHGRIPLHLAAAMHAELHILNLLLAQEANVAHTTPLLETPLHAAGRAGNSLTFARLVLAGANPLQPNSRGDSPIDLLRRHRRTEDSPGRQISTHSTPLSTVHGPVVLRLSDSLERGSTLLHAMAAAGELEPMRHLLDRTPVDIRDSLQMTPLHRAIIANHLPAVVELLARNADPRLQAQNGSSALHFAAAHASPLIIYAIIATGVDVNTRDAQGRTAMHIAANVGRMENVQALRTHGAAIDLTDSEGNTPLLRAARRGFLEMCAFLIAQGANVYTENAEGQNFLAITDAHGYTEVRSIIAAIIPTTLREAIAVGDHRGMLGALAASHNPRALLEETNNLGQTVMHELVAQARPLYQREAPTLRLPLAIEREITPREVIETLRGVAPLTGRWMINHRDYLGMTPVHIAVILNRADLIEELARQGADLEVADDEGMTPALLAANEGHLDALLALLRHGANPNARDQRGHTALHLAARWGHTNLMAALIRNGADLFAEDLMRRTPWMLTAQHPHLRNEITDYVTMMDAQFETIARGPESWEETLRATNTGALAAAALPLPPSGPAPENVEAIPERGENAIRQLIQRMPSTRWILSMLHPRTQAILGGLFTFFLHEIRATRSAP